MAAKKGFVIYFDWREQFELLPLEDRGRLLMALLDYGESGRTPDLHDAVGMAFSFMRAQMDRDATKYAERCAINAENGAKGGRPKKPNTSGENQAQPTKTERFLDKPRKADTGTDTGIDTGIDTGTDTGKGISPPSPSDEGADEGKKDVIEARFAEFWNAYPKKVAKQYALKAWKRLRPDAELHEKIMQAVNAQKRSEQWRRDNGRYIPNPATWLNGGQWDNELEEVTTDAENRGDPERSSAADAGRDYAKGFKTADDLDSI